MHSPGDFGHHTSSNRSPCFGRSLIISCTQLWWVVWTLIMMDWLGKLLVRMFLVRISV